MGESRRWYEGLSGRGIRPGLGSILALTSRMGDPQKGMRFIHVAGSDGKGSVCAMTESVLLKSDFKVGAFTTPHILDETECIRIQGRDISADEFESLLSEVRPFAESLEAEGISCTSFEVLTAAALLFFKESGMEIAIMEVGMGGRFDATNIIAPDVTVINNISLEHRAYLGDTIEEIAWQKAGIMKPGVPCVTINGGKVFDVLAKNAEDVGCPLEKVDPASITPVEGGMVFEGRRYSVSLPGEFQLRNAALALKALSKLPEFRERIEDHVADGLSQTFLPCRIQHFPELHLTIDVTHTAAGAEALASHIAKMHGKVVLVLAMLDDKDIEAVARIMSSVTTRAYVSAPASPRASSSERVRDALVYCNINTTICGTVADAVETALRENAGKEVLVTGSFRTAEDCMKWLRTRSA